MCQFQSANVDSWIRKASRLERILYPATANSQAWRYAPGMLLPMRLHPVDLLVESSPEPFSIFPAGFLRLSHPFLPTSVASVSVQRI
jgi:hypothetical protein